MKSIKETASSWTALAPTRDLAARAAPRRHVASGPLEAAGGRPVVVLLFAAIVVTALAHGAVEPWSLALFELIATAMVVAWTVVFIKRGRISLSLPKAALPFAALIILCAIQALALTDPSGRRISLSKDVDATRNTLTVLILLLAAFLASYNFLAGRSRLRNVARFLSLYGLALAVFGIIQHLAWNGRIYWIGKMETEGASPFGPFVNHDHFAGYMILLIPIPAAIAMDRAADRVERIFYTFSTVVMAVSAVASLSRGGMIALVAETLFLVLLGLQPVALARDHSARRRLGRLIPALSTLRGLAGAGLIIAIVAGGVLWISADAVIERVAYGNRSQATGAAETFHESRGWIWRDSLAMFKSNPVLGVGIGAFEASYPIYSKANGSLLVSQAHNDYLQALTDGGVVGGLIVIWFLAAAIRPILLGLQSHDPFINSLSLGCAASVFGILVHSLFDFNLQLPSTALLFLVIAGIGLGIGDRRAERRKKRHETGAASQPAPTPTSPDC